MLSYQHAYHAGNLADLHKHIALATIWQKLSRKPRPLSFVETHAGRGLYQTDSIEAKKTGEFREGIEVYRGGALVYDDVLRKVRVQYGEKAYPGSPMIIQTLARQNDKIALAELHPQEVKALRDVFKPYQNTHIHHRDGFEMLLALAPMTPRKGLVHIDPSYEVKSEYQTVREFCDKLLRKWPEATVMIWYPRLLSKDYETLFPLLQRRNALHAYAEFHNTSQLRMKGTGLILLNAPFGTKDALETAFSPLASIFAHLTIDESN